MRREEVLTFLLKNKFKVATTTFYELLQTISGEEIEISWWIWCSR